MDINYIQQLLPNYEVFTPLTSTNIYILGKFGETVIFKSDQTYEYIESIIDVHNTYKYVIEFLLLNNFVCKLPENNIYINYNNNISIRISPNGYHYKFKTYSSQELLSLLREELDLDSLNKQVIL